MYWKKINNLINLTKKMFWKNGTVFCKKRLMPWGGRTRFVDRGCASVVVLVELVRAAKLWGARGQVPGCVWEVLGCRAKGGRSRVRSSLWEGLSPAFGAEMTLETEGCYGGRSSSGVGKCSNTWKGGQLLFVAEEKAGKLGRHCCTFFEWVVSYPV